MATVILGLVLLSDPLLRCEVRGSGFVREPGDLNNGLFQSRLSRFGSALPLPGTLCGYSLPRSPAVRLSDFGSQFGRISVSLTVPIAP